MVRCSFTSCSMLSVTWCFFQAAQSTSTTPRFTTQLFFETSRGEKNHPLGFAPYMRSTRLGKVPPPFARIKPFHLFPRVPRPYYLRSVGVQGPRKVLGLTGYFACGWLAAQRIVLPFSWFCFACAELQLFPKDGCKDRGTALILEVMLLTRLFGNNLLFCCRVVIERLLPAAPFLLFRGRRFWGFQQRIEPQIGGVCIHEPSPKRESSTIHAALVGGPSFSGKSWAKKEAGRTWP